MSEVTIGPGTALEVVTAAIEAGASLGDTLTLTDSGGNTHAVTIGERITLPSTVAPMPPI